MDMDTQPGSWSDWCTHHQLVLTEEGRTRVVPCIRAATTTVRTVRDDIATYIPMCEQHAGAE